VPLRQRQVQATRRAVLEAARELFMMWLLMSPDQYYRLVHRRHWTQHKYERWLAASIVHMLFGERP
jgi:hypothetical protein